jgi:sugar phosphate isomerase/epimerase
MISSVPDGTGVEFVERLAALGFDYIELPLAEMTALSDDAFAALVEKVENSGIACEACNNFFPKTLRLTGLDVDKAAIRSYVELAMYRAHRLGVECVVFGSGPAKNVPEGFSMGTGYRQVVDLLKETAPLAKQHNITIVIEPLRSPECNLINTFAEGCRLARDVDHPNVRVLVDFYHLSQESESVEHLVQDGEAYLRHVHFACGEGRVFPTAGNEDDYPPFFEALRAVKYDRRISLEAYSSAFEKEAPVALRFFRQQFTREQ